MKEKRWRQIPPMGWNVNFSKFHLSTFPLILSGHFYFRKSLIIREFHNNVKHSLSAVLENDFRVLIKIISDTPLTFLLTHCIQVVFPRDKPPPPQTHLREKLIFNLASGKPQK